MLSGSGMKHLAVFTLVLLSLSSCIDPDPLPPDPEDPVLGEGTGLMGSYFDTQGRFVGSRVDPVISFFWERGSSPLSGVPADYFSVVWTGELEVPVSGEYVFSVFGDDGARVFVDGQSVVPSGAWSVWGSGVSASERVFVGDPVVLDVGRYPVRVEFFEMDWNAAVELNWTRPDGVFEVVPTEYLYPGNPVNSPPEDLPYDSTQPGPSPQPTPDPTATPDPDPEEPLEPPGEGLTRLTYRSLDHNVFIINPERGWHGYGNLMAETPGFANYYSRAINDPSIGLTLSGGSIRLDQWRNTEELPPWVLERIERSFTLARNEGIKIIPRVSYNFGDGPDAQQHIIEAHIEQLGPIFHDNYDVIAMIPAGFIGQWGEWHGSNHGLTADSPDGVHARREIVNAIFEHMVHEDRMLKVRAPRFVIEYATGSRLASTDTSAYNEYAPAPGFVSDRASRIGMYNDCFLTGPVNGRITDVGTYEWDQTLMRPLFEYAQPLGVYTPMGGETCDTNWNTRRSYCTADGTYPYYGAMHEMDLLGFDYLNLDYHRGHVERWITQGCYDNITNRLGYRYYLTRIDYTGDVSRGSDLYVSLSFVNDGFGSLYNPRPVELVLRSTGGYERRFTLAQDARTALPLSGDDRTLTRNVRIPNDMPAGDYRLYLALPDDAPSIRDDHRYSIRLANPDMWTAGTSWNGLNDLGATVRIT